MKKRPSASTLQHLEARQEMLSSRLTDMENRIYGRNNRFIPFITDEEGKISEQNLNSFIKELMDGLYKSGERGLITNKDFKELCDCFFYCALQGIGEYDELSRCIVRRACYFSDIVDIARHKNNLLFAEKNTLYKFEFETAGIDEADEYFDAKFVNEFQWGGFFRYCDIVYYTLTGKSITVTFEKDKHHRFTEEALLETARACGFNTAEDYDKWVSECEETEKECCFERALEECEEIEMAEQYFSKLADERKQAREEFMETAMQKNSFVNKYMRFRELFFSLDLYYRYMLFEYAEFMIDLFLYSKGMSSISEDESFAMIYYRTNKLCAAVQHEAARRENDKGQERIL